MIKELSINFIVSLIDVLYVLILVRIILSWFPVKIGKFRLFVFDITEIVLKPVRKIIPPIGGVIDLSPIVVFLILQIIQALVSKI